MPRLHSPTSDNKRCHSSERVCAIKPKPQPPVSGIKRWSYIVMLVSALGGCISAIRTKPNLGDYEPHILKRGTYLAQHSDLLGLSLSRHQ